MYLYFTHSTGFLIFLSVCVHFTQTYACIFRAEPRARRYVCVSRCKTIRWTRMSYHRLCSYLIRLLTKTVSKTCYTGRLVWRITSVLNNHTRSKVYQSHEQKDEVLLIRVTSRSIRDVVSVLNVSVSRHFLECLISSRS